MTKSIYKRGKKIIIEYTSSCAPNHYIIVQNNLKWSCMATAKNDLVVLKKSRKILIRPRKIVTNQKSKKISEKVKTVKPYQQTKTLLEPIK